MPRIRQVKPEYFRHEELQKLGTTTMLFFAGLWTQADKAGNFYWKPSQLKLDILPFIDYDPGISLEALWKTGFVIPYTGSDGKRYGHIPTFEQHQRFFGTEATSKPRFPDFIDGEGYQGNSMEIPSKPQGNHLDRGLRVKGNGNRVKGIGNIYDEKFEEFWKIYPTRNGKKVGRKTSRDLFFKQQPEDFDWIIANAKNYGIGNAFPKDPERFLKNEFWKDWDEPMKGENNGTIRGNFKPTRQERLNADATRILAERRAREQATVNQGSV